MPQSRKPRAVNIGLVGQCNEFSSMYLTALHAIRERMQLSWIYDAIPFRSNQIAIEHKLQQANGLHQLARQHDINALLLLNNHWYRHIPLEICLKFQKSAVCMSPFPWDADQSTLQNWHSRLGELGISFVLGFYRRYSPTTIRLQELIVSKIGAVREIQLTIKCSNAKASIPANSPADGVHENIPEDNIEIEKDKGNGESPSQQNSQICPEILQAIDWCRHILNRKLILKTEQNLESTLTNPCSLTFHTQPSETHPETTIRIDYEESDEHETQNSWLINVVAENGKAELSGLRRISFHHGNTQHHDELLSERCGLDVLLDLFCRRLMGGLVPLPDIGDLMRAKEALNIFT